MATIISLVVPGGLTGIVVDIVGEPLEFRVWWQKYQNGTRLNFYNNGDTLPTGLTHGVTYYIKQRVPQIDHYFDLCTDAALTSVVSMSGTHSGTHILKSPIVTNPSSELSAYGLSDLSRWGSNIFDGITSWRAARSAATNNFNDEICEIGDAFMETASWFTSFVNVNSVVIHTKINNIRTPAFHNGIVNTGGYKFYFNRSSDEAIVLYGRSYNWSLDGFKVECFGNGIGVSSQSPYGVIKSLIVINNDPTCTTGYGFFCRSLTIIDTCVSIGYYYGIKFEDYSYGGRVTNCVFAKAIGTGVVSGGSNAGCILFNCVSIGSGVADWGTQVSSLELASNNQGATGTPWVTSGGVNGTVATTDFADYTNNDFSPATVTSPQVGFGFEYYGISGGDIVDAYRPAYPGAAYGTDVSAGSFVTGLSYSIASVGTTIFTTIGASANTIGVIFKATGAGTGTGTATLLSRYDTGPYQFDLGYGDWPASATVTFSGVHSGSEIRVYDSAGSELAGVETCATDDPVLTWTLPVGDVRIVIINTAYKIIDFSYTSVSGVVALPVQQEIDKWYSNP